MRYFNEKKSVHCSNRKRKAFSITEVIVASSLMAVALIPILKGLTGVNLNSKIIEQKSKSLELAQYKLNEVQARSIYNYSSSLAQNETELETNYLCDVSDSAISTNLRQVTIVVGFNDDGDSNLDSSEHDITLVTKLAKRW